MMKAPERPWLKAERPSSEWLKDEDDDEEEDEEDDEGAGHLDSNVHWSYESAAGAEKGGGRVLLCGGVLLVTMRSSRSKALMQAKSPQTDPDLSAAS